MNCPSCHNTMTPSEICLEVPLVNLVIGGGGLSELLFREPERDPVPIMTTSDSRPALHCKTCDMVLIINDTEYTETECVVCHTAMPAGITSCPKCAWTYEQTS